MIRFIAILVFFFFTANVVHAQPEKAIVETVNGKKYFVHIVEKGNTLYGIHKMYKTSVEDILASNKGMSDELELGQKILIPIPTSNVDYYTEHKVVQGETLYGISKKYACSVSDIQALNNGLSEGISPGQKLVVPKFKNDIAQHGERIQTDPIIKETYDVTLFDSIIYHTVLAHETMYSISKRYMVSSDTILALNNLKTIKIQKGDILQIPVKKVSYTIEEKDLTTLVQPPSDTVRVVKGKRKDTYNIALILPLMLDRNETEMGKSLRTGQIREMYPTTRISFEFYQGFRFAADSLRKAGFNVKIYVYDTNKDTTVISKIFKQKEFEDMDLVVGPLFKSTIDFTVELCKKKQIPIILPFNSETSNLYKNPFVYKTVTSNMSLIDGEVDYILKSHHQHNIILIKPTSADDIALFERAREKLELGLKMYPNAYNVRFVETTIGSASGKELNNHIKKDTVNIILIPSANQTYVSNAMNTLNKVMNLNPYNKNLKVIVFGLEEWNKFDEIDIKYRNRVNQHYASYRFVDYNNGSGLAFVKSYRAQYGTDPNVYSVQGFDVGMYFMGALHLYGTNFENYMGKYKMELVQNSFDFKQAAPDSGFENKGVCVVSYDNYRLVKKSK